MGFAPENVILCDTKGVVYKGRVWAKGLKQRNRTAYYVGKWVILGGILALILFA